MKSYWNHWIQFLIYTVHFPENRTKLPELQIRAVGTRTTNSWDGEATTKKSTKKRTLPSIAKASNPTKKIIPTPTKQAEPSQLMSEPAPSQVSLQPRWPQSQPCSWGFSAGSPGWPQMLRQNSCSGKTMTPGHTMDPFLAGLTKQGSMEICVFLAGNAKVWRNKQWSKICHEHYQGLVRSWYRLKKVGWSKHNYIISKVWPWYDDMPMVRWYTFDKNYI